MGSSAKSRATAAAITSALVASLLGAGSLLGCSPAEMGSIDMAKAKSIAAESGIDQKRGLAGGTPKKKRGTTVQPGLQGRMEAR
ncbi:hypothetical protein [Paludisphaera soli]|uniref:hypothetical protein n=1 Tax=Paludisphaera soli TaxID=2712865 RepID=UPI0013ECBDF6|nr:hypothetical protein [Paludisphaera soli]